MIDYLQWLLWAITDGFLGCYYNFKRWRRLINSDFDKGGETETFIFWLALGLYTWCDSSYKSWDNVKGKA